MKNLIIIGARGFGREVYNLALDCISAYGDFEIKGFLDDKVDALQVFPNYPPILNSVENYVIQKDDVFICALGETVYKKKYSELILNKGGNFISLIHPLASIKQNTHIGKGCIIAGFAHISCDVTIDDFVTIHSFSVIGHDAQIGKWSMLSSYSFMGGSAILDEGVTLHTGAKVLPHKKVGQWATVGVDSVVIKNVSPYITVYGNPALKIIF